MHGGEDNRAADPENQHQRGLPDEPFTHAGVGAQKGTIETFTLRLRKERQHPLVGLVAFDHEINRQYETGYDADKPARPVAHVAENAAGNGGCFTLQFGVQRGDVNARCNGQLLDPGEEFRSSFRQIGNKGRKIMQGRGKCKADK